MRRSVALFVFGIAAIGCSPSGGARVDPPSLSPRDAAEKAMVDYDANRDGLLDAAELEKCPALKSAIARFDKNTDQKISLNEIEARLQLYRDTRSGIAAVPCRVLMDGAALHGAIVTFEPEPFLGTSFKPAHGVSENDGTVALRTEGYDVEGLPYGLFRVRVSKKDASGKELVPSKFNTQTTLGQEVGPDMRGDIVIKVSRR